MSERKQGVTEWEIDASHTDVAFAVKHMMVTTVKGRFAGVSGLIRLDEADPTRSSVVATLDAATIDTRVGQRDDHLRSADFLDVEHYPEITFRSTALEEVERGEYRLTGELTIRGVTRPVTLAVERGGRAKDPWGGERIGFSASGRIRRADFGLTWNQALETGGVLVGDEVKLTLEVEAVKQARMAAA